MVHRSNMFTVSIDEDAENIINTVIDSPYTRIPVWQNDAENIIGIIHAKNLLRLISSTKDKVISREDIKKTLLEPHTTLAQHFTMVCAENHHGVLGLTTGLQRLHQFSHLVVNKRDHCVIPLTGAALIVLCHPVPVPAMCKKTKHERRNLKPRKAVF